MDSLPELSKVLASLQAEEQDLVERRKAVVKRIKQAKQLGFRTLVVKGRRDLCKKLLWNLPAKTREWIYANPSVGEYYPSDMPEEHAQALLSAEMAHITNDKLYRLTLAAADAIGYLRNPEALDNEIAELRAEIAAWLETQRKTVATVKASLTVPDAEAEALGGA